MRRYLGDHLCEDVRCQRQSEREGPELENPVPPHKAEVSPLGLVYENMKVGVFEIDGRCPVPWSDGISHGSGGVHLEFDLLYEAIQR